MSLSYWYLPQQIATLTPLLVVLAIWELAIKGVALWHAAKNCQKYWFVALLVLNTAGILPLVYLGFFQRNCC